MTRYWTPIIAGIAVAVLAAPAMAQEWTVDAYAGRAVYDPVASAVGATNGVAAIRYGDRRQRWIYAAAAAPLSARDLFWTAAGLGGRLSSSGGQFPGGIALGAHGHGYRDPISGAFGGGGSLEVSPYLSLGSDAARLEIRTGWVQYAGTFDGSSTTRGALDSGARGAFRALPSLDLGAEVRYVRAREGGYPFAGGSATLRHGGGEFWATTGRWLSEALSQTSWAAGTSVRVASRLELWGSVQHEATEPIYLNASRRSWNLGVSHRLGTPPEAAAPVPPEIGTGIVVVRLPTAGLKDAPYIAGDFSGWQAMPMVRSGEYWTARLKLEAGVYRYAFRTADGKWFVPESAPGRRDDGMGGATAILVVQ